MSWCWSLVAVRVPFAIHKRGDEDARADEADAEAATPGVGVAFAVVRDALIVVVVHRVASLPSGVCGLFRAVSPIPMCDFHTSMCPHVAIAYASASSCVHIVVGCVLIRHARQTGFVALGDPE